jgi:hypothetical protein
VHLLRRSRPLCVRLPSQVQDFLLLNEAGQDHLHHQRQAKVGKLVRESLKLSTTSPVTFQQTTTRSLDPCTLIRYATAPVQLKGRGGTHAATLNPDALHSCISLDLVEKLKLQKHYLNQPIAVTNVNGRTSNSGLATYKCRELIILNGFITSNFQLLVLPASASSTIVLGYDYVKIQQQRQDLKNTIIKKRSRLVGELDF